MIYTESFSRGITVVHSGRHLSSKCAISIYSHVALTSATVPTCPNNSVVGRTTRIRRLQLLSSLRHSSCSQKCARLVHITSTAVGLVVWPSLLHPRSIY